MKRYKAYFTIDVEGEYNIVAPSREEAIKMLDSYIHNELPKESLESIMLTTDTDFSYALREVKEKKHE